MTFTVHDIEAGARAAYHENVKLANESGAHDADWTWERAHEDTRIAWRRIFTAGLSRLVLVPLPVVKDTTTCCRCGEPKSHPWHNVTGALADTNKHEYKSA